MTMFFFLTDIFAEQRQHHMLDLCRWELVDFLIAKFRYDTKKKRKKTKTKFIPEIFDVLPLSAFSFLCLIFFFFLPYYYYFFKILLYLNCVPLARKYYRWCLYFLLQLLAAVFCNRIRDIKKHFLSPSVDVSRSDTKRLRNVFFLLYDYYKRERAE